MPVDFIAEVTGTENRLRATADIKVNRANYGIKFKSKTFFPDLGDNFIHDDFFVKVSLDLPKQNG
jgi:hypothetical protein